MYTLIDKQDQKVIIYFETSALSRLLNIDRATLYRWFKEGNKKETDDYTIYKADEIKKKTRKTGNRDDKATRARKLWEKNN